MNHSSKSENELRGAGKVTEKDLPASFDEQKGARA